MTIDYSDGTAVETKVLKLVSQSTDLRSTCNVALTHYDEEWSNRYHLCAERGNLLRHFDFSGLDILELGAGMGAVSRCIAEKCSHLTVVEGTEARFNVLKQRLRDLNNWDGSVCNIQEFKTDRKFDAVCVIGVLEYSELYIDHAQFNAASAHKAFIKHAKSFLKEDGVLIVAIENRIGLKYWSGCSEDHTHKLFDGILDYPTNKTARTFSNHELENLLTTSGFREIKKYYPFPDYKIAKSILTEEIIENHSQLAAELASVAPFDSYGETRARLMHDGLAMLSLGRAGLIQEFANSFLFVGSNLEYESSTLLKKVTAATTLRRELAWTYSLDRIPKVETTFFLDRSKDLLTVSKRALSDDRPENKAVIWQRPPEQVVFPLPAFRSVLIRELYFENSTRFFELFYDFISWSFNRWSDSSELSGDSLDALWINCCYNPTQVNERYVLFDLEWKNIGLVCPSYFIFRNVLAFSREWNLFRKSSGVGCLQDLYETTCKHFGLISHFEEFSEREAFFQTSVHDRKLVNARVEIITIMNRPFDSTGFIRSSERLNDVLTLENTLVQKNLIIQSQHRVLRRIQHRVAGKVGGWFEKVPGIGHLFT